MGCEICGRGNCTRSFHSLDEQQDFDSVADGIKERLKSRIESQVNRLKEECIDGNYYVLTSEVIDIIQSAD